MLVKFNGQTSPLALTNGKEYPVESTECGWYRIMSGDGESYLYPPDLFDVIDPSPVPPETEPAPMPTEMLMSA